MNFPCFTRKYSLIRLNNSKEWNPISSTVFYWGSYSQNTLHRFCPVRLWFVFGLSLGVQLSYCWQSVQDQLLFFSVDWTVSVVWLVGGREGEEGGGYPLHFYLLDFTPCWLHGWGHRFYCLVSPLYYKLTSCRQVISIWLLFGYVFNPPPNTHTKTFSWICAAVSCKSFLFLFLFSLTGSWGGQWRWGGSFILRFHEEEIRVAD